jgi:hypothetical protein
MLLVLSAVVLLAQPGSPTESPKGQETVAAASPEEAKESKPKRTCRAEAVLGSRLPVTLCATAEQWEARRVKDKEKLDAIQHAVRNPNPGDP